jgi:hypothetical protein
MRFPQPVVPTMVANFAMLLVCIAGSSPEVKADLHWPPPKKETLRIRLVAQAESDPRSSFFSSHEIFVAAQQLKGENETRLVKLVYAFLPYQPRLSEYGFDYSLVYELHATRDESCDQSLTAMTTDQRDRAHVQLKYTNDSPGINEGRRHSLLPCYSSSPEDYTRVVHEPTGPETEF